MSDGQSRPQAGAVSCIRHRIFVRRKSAKKIWLAVFAAKKVWLAEYYYRRKYRYTTTVSVC